MLVCVICGWGVHAHALQRLPHVRFAHSSSAMHPSATAPCSGNAAQNHVPRTSLKHTRCCEASLPALDTHRVDIRFILGYLWPHGGKALARLRVLASLVLLIAAKLYVVRVPFLFKHAIDSLGRAPLRNAAGWLFAYGFSRSVYTLLQEGRYLLFTPVGQSALRRFMRDSFAHVQSLDSMWLSSQSTGELSRVFARGMRGMNALLRLLLFNVLPTALEAVLAIMMLGTRYGSGFLLTSLITVLSFVTWTLFIVQRRVQLLARVNENDNAIFIKFFNSLLNNEAVRINVNERYEVGQYDGLLSRAEGLAINDVQTVSVLNAGQALIYWTGLGVIMSLCARGVVRGALTLGDAVAINGLLLQLHSPLTALGYTYQEIRQALTDMRQLLELLRRRPRVVSVPRAAELHVRRGDIEFEDVSFGYTTAGGNLRNVSFTAPAGLKTAIVGSSGSGKSTVLKMILRLHDPDSGRVLIDGEDIRLVSLNSLRREVALIPQDTILFDDSIMHNIRYGNLSAPEAFALEVAERVGLNVTAHSLPDGYNTRVGERGMGLSGGERQRVAIARALLAQPSLVLCDEPTSALDSLTETTVQQVLDDSFRGRTSVVVAHKLRSVLDADQILVMRDGQLVEQGSHLSLLCSPNSTYSRMWAQQTAGAEDALDDLNDYCELLDGSGLARMSLNAAQNALDLRTLEGEWLW